MSYYQRGQKHTLKSKGRESSVDIANITENTDIGYDAADRRGRSDSPNLQKTKILKKRQTLIQDSKSKAALNRFPVYDYTNKFNSTQSLADSYEKSQSGSLYRRMSMNRNIHRNSMKNDIQNMLQAINKRKEDQR